MRSLLVSFICNKHYKKHAVVAGTVGTWPGAVSHVGQKLTQCPCEAGIGSLTYVGSGLVGHVKKVQKADH